MSGESGQERGPQPGESGKKLRVASINKQRAENGEPPLGSTPTEASKGFLAKFRDRLMGINDSSGVAFVRFIGGSVSLGLAIDDLILGNYSSAVAEGVVGGVALAPVARQLLTRGVSLGKK